MMFSPRSDLLPSWVRFLMLRLPVSASASAWTRAFRRG